MTARRPRRVHPFRTIGVMLLAFTAVALAAYAIANL